MSEAQIASRLKKIIQPPPPPTPPDKILEILWRKKIFLRRCTEIYRYLPSKCFEIAVLGLQEMVQCKCFFLTPNKKIFAGKCLKWEKVLVVFRERIIFNVKWVEACKKSEVVWVKLYCKMSDLFRWFLLALRRFCKKNWNLKKL